MSINRNELSEGKEHNKRLTNSELRSKMLKEIKNMNFDSDKRLIKSSLDKVLDVLEKDVLGTTKGVFTYEKNSEGYYLSYLGVKLDIPLKKGIDLVNAANFVDSVIDNHINSGKDSSFKADKSWLGNYYDLDIKSGKHKLELNQEKLEEIIGDKKFRGDETNLATKFKEFFKKVKETEKKIYAKEVVDKRKIDFEEQKIIDNALGFPSSKVNVSVYDLGKTKDYVLHYAGITLKEPLHNKLDAIYVGNQMRKFIEEKGNFKLSIKDKKIVAAIQGLKKEAEYK